MIRSGVLSQCNDCSFQNFPWDANYNTRRTIRELSTFPCLCLRQAIVVWRDKMRREDKVEALYAKFV